MFLANNSLNRAVVDRKFVEFPELKGKVKDFSVIAESIKNFKDIEDAK